ncbi:chemotaxis protein CheY [Gordoniibacillus kamchatkensis]|uniref:Protein-glutamate methylesterase/protein-glutamine glutaminase n=1 Tax=Gordoniibacillus kamchatkensis TaxID=1590651 RepID=A0ABR5AE57_9BACL|nr:chemotaxis response regulator protein-glutamate methylesterase [Paenibacillus sp. VKM B-2647]KIL39230.1 chemotaxis protein CheY [Paenibacillus sp. VKM B-2647]
MTYRILVVDDSVFMRRIISDLIAEDPELEVIGTARNGKEAVEQVKLLRPQAVTLDVEMPEMNGLEALRHIMSEAPTPVIMLSSLTQEGARETIRALELGAFDFICKPSGSISLDLYKVKQQLHEKLRAAVKANVKKASPLAAQAALPPKPAPAAPAARGAAAVPNAAADKPAGSTQFEHLIAIGTSTGGPRALHHVVSQLPSNLPAPVLIVQHMPPNFTKSLAQRLNDVSRVKVVEAEDGQVLETGTAYVAPGGWHMTAHRDSKHVYRIRLNKDDPRSGHRPSVDVLFESLVPLKELKRHAVIMTGMGSDGARGMLAMRQSGAVTTIAEAEESCVVYGMPRAAAKLNAATDVLMQQDIARKLAQSVGCSG